MSFYETKFNSILFQISLYLTFYLIIIYLKCSKNQVALQVSCLVLVDIFILILWTILNRPRQRSYFSRVGGLYVPVEYTQCSTGLDDRFEQAMLAWKALLLAAGVYKSI